MNDAKWANSVTVTSAQTSEGGGTGRRIRYYPGHCGVCAAGGGSGGGGIVRIYVRGFQVGAAVSRRALNFPFFPIIQCWLLLLKSPKRRRIRDQ